MKLTELLEDIEIIKVDNLSEFEVKGITDNSREVKDGFLFVALQGERYDGCDFIQEAIERGAKGVVISQVSSVRWQVSNMNKRLERVFIYVKDARRALWQLAVRFYDDPSQKVRCIGVTGTNGKTTVTSLLESIFTEADFSCGVLGTINYRFNGRVIPAVNTTPDSVFLQSMLGDMVRAGVNYCVLEVSSHSLEQGRVGGMNFKYGIFTNLTSDHLDYHKDVLSYFEAKTKLFKMLNKQACAVINIDDDYGAQLVKQTQANVITYGLNNFSDVYGYDLKLSLQGTEFKVKTSKGELEVMTRLIGRHNVYNVLSAIAVAIEENICLEDVLKGIYNLNKVAGRLERIEGDYPFKVFVDYAHTEDALKNILTSLGNIISEYSRTRRQPRGQLIVVFGCGGDRDRSKRPKMGNVASRLADVVIVTLDNPRTEEPQKIIEDIVSGISQEIGSEQNRRIEIVPDRYSAIEKALLTAEKGDIVLIAGKGHEQYQIFKDKKIRFDDRKVIRELLSAKNKKSKPRYTPP